MKYWRRRGRKSQVLLVLVLAGGVLRLSPFVAPIRPHHLERGESRLVRFFDRQGHLLGSVLAGGDQACQPVSLDQVAPSLVEAFVAAEDQRFFTHGGVDFRALVRAAHQNLRARRVVSGGSTLTMQLARLLKPKRRTVVSKLQEIYTAWRLEAGMSKKEILEAYLNRVPMGRNLVGVGAASQVYLGIPPSALNVAQASFLATLPQDPVRHDPGRHPNAWRARQAYVLRRMVQTGALSPAQAENVGQVELKLNLAPSEPGLAAWHFFFHLLQSLPESTTEVVVTLDRELQEYVAQQAAQVVAHLAARGVTNAAAVVVDNNTAEIRAYVGSASFFEVSHQGQVDGVQARRQPGSSLKPFLYALALERGFTPASILPDLPTAFPLLPGSHYEPENYDQTFHGPVRLRVALANSYNVPACYLTAQFGAAALLQRLQEWGFRSLQKGSDHYGLGLVLGNGEVTLYELARAYSALARGGRLREPVAVLQLNGQSPLPGLPESSVGEPLTAYLVADILADRHARTPAFGARSALNLPFWCAVKTGTSSHFRDNWTVGFTPDYTVAVWVGNFDGTPMQEVSGVAGAGPLFARIMAHLYAGRNPPLPPPRPPSLVSRPLCPLSGQKPGPACPYQTDELFRKSHLEAYERTCCDWHRTVVCDARTGQPAGPDCPPEWRIEEVRVELPEMYQVKARRNAGTGEPFKEISLPEGSSPATITVHRGLRGHPPEALHDIYLRCLD